MQSKVLTLTALAAGLMAASGMAHSQFSSTITATSDYDFRGFSQSATDPALQASLDYAFGESGFAIGAWASNVDFGNDDDLEADYYLNYTGAINDDFSWGAGYVYYDYPSGDDTRGYWEINTGVTFKDLGGKLWYADDYLGAGESAYYLEGNYNFAFNDAWSLQLHAGYSFGDFWDAVGDELIDYSIGGTYTFSNFNISLKFTGTDASGDLKIEDDIGNNEGRVVLSVATTLPWGE
jgi:uncharacterized protein (TIGR02001 family)